MQIQNKKSDILVSSETIEKSHTDKLDFKLAGIGRGRTEYAHKRPALTGRPSRRLTNLGPEELEEFRQELLEIRHRLLAGKGQSVQQDRVENANRSMALLHEIDEALIRIDSKTYGICQASQKVISKSLLKGMPWARYAYND